MKRVSEEMCVVCWISSDGRSRWGRLAGWFVGNVTAVFCWKRERASKSAVINTLFSWTDQLYESCVCYRRAATAAAAAAVAAAENDRIDYSCELWTLSLFTRSRAATRSLMVVCFIQCCSDLPLNKFYSFDRSSVPFHYRARARSLSLSISSINLFSFWKLCALFCGGKF